eukprot:CAMPEP_0185397658 /NCGR_PEP_ID=MMETSP1364-20130426/87228_1 /TAXON_ID=38817 /ORGANISM="Gephyrocapsa oceanica, Strain RCC1303" /LENGTH=110 /DNA_ID=CAMNT_0027999895 /DNA_START=1 /DNA_END=333 /DNA_ORIENTATION=-
MGGRRAAAVGGAHGALGEHEHAHAARLRRGRDLHRGAAPAAGANLDGDATLQLVGAEVRQATGRAATQEPDCARHPRGRRHAGVSGEADVCAVRTLYSTEPSSRAVQVRT